jgi:hypothetical protein
MTNDSVVNSSFRLSDSNLTGEDEEDERKDLEESTHAD